MPFVPDNPRLEGRYRQPDIQNPTGTIVRRLLGSMMTNDALNLLDTTSRSTIAPTTPLPCPQSFPKSAPHNIVPDLPSMRARTVGVRSPRTRTNQA